MTNRSKASLQALFEDGDVPTGSNYSDLIDSSVNVAETSAQTMQGPLVTTELIATRVSATNANFTGLVSAGSLNAAGLVTPSLVANGSTFIAGTLTITAPPFITAAITANGGMAVSNGLATDTFSSNTCTISGDVSANGVHAPAGFFGGVGIVLAAGSAQATAAILTNFINRGKGVVDGSTTGYTPMANKSGFVQYLYNEGASANLWPPTGGFINGLAVNTPFSLAASAMVTIVHLTASAYAVK